jgi:integrase
MLRIDDEVRQAITEINARLKIAKIGVTVEARGNRLSVRGTFPPKPGEKAAKNKQRYLPLGFHTNPAGLREAEKKAKKIGAQLDNGEFNWADWQSTADIEPVPEKKLPNVSEWTERFEADYFDRRKRSPKSESTWHDDYLQPLNKLPQDEPLTAEILRQAILKTKPDTRTRQRFCMSYGAFARFAGLDFDAKRLRGEYSAKQLTPRDLPTDPEISAWRDRISNPRWQWAFGVIATYGLRPHEIFYLDLENMRSSHVLSLIEDENGGGKTGRRKIWPLYPEWRERWRLWEVELMPTANGPNNKALGLRVSREFAKDGFKNTYNLRHRWAVRAIECGISVALAAKQMGHSMAVHTKTYHYWIDDEVHQRDHDLAMNRPDRPIAP